MLELAARLLHPGGVLHILCEQCSSPQAHEQIEQAIYIDSPSEIRLPSLVRQSPGKRQYKDRIKTLKLADLIDLILSCELSLYDDEMSVTF